MTMALRAFFALKAATRRFSVANFQDRSLHVSSSNSLNFWIATCSTKQERESFYSMAGESFFNSTISKRYLPDEERRKEFLPAFFRYAYEEKVKGGLAKICLAKTWETVNGEAVAKILYGGVAVFDTTPCTKSDPSEILKIYKSGAEIMLKMNEWRYQTIQKPMQQMAEAMGSAAWYLAHQATAEAYKSLNFATKYSPITSMVAYESGLERRRRGNEQTYQFSPFTYVITTDTFPGAWRLLKRWRLAEVGHFHFHYKPGLKCYRGTGVQREDEISCFVPVVDAEIAPLIKEKFFQYAAKVEGEEASLSRTHSW